MMGEVPIDRAAAARALEGAVVRASLLLGGLGDTSAQIKGSEWTVRDAAAHVISYASLWEAALQGQRSPIDDVSTLARHNERLIAAVKERTGRELAERLTRDYGQVVLAAEKFPADLRILWHEGMLLDVPGALSLALSELLVHGYDIARTVRAPWPITRHDAGLASAGGTRMLHLGLDSNKAGSTRMACGFRLRPTPEFAVVVDRRTATVECPPVSPLDCRVSGDPVSFLLVSYGRVPQWSAVLRAKLRAGGRNPWLVARFSRLVKAP